MVNQRMNIYAFPHKGLKNALSQLLNIFGKACFTSSEDIGVVKSMTKEVIQLLHLHQDAEDKCVLLPLAERKPDASKECFTEHTRLHEMVNVIQQASSDLSHDQARDKLEHLYQSISFFCGISQAHGRRRINLINCITIGE